MKSEKIEELKKKNQLRRLLQKLSLIDESFSKNSISFFNSDYKTILDLSEKHIVDVFKAEGSKVVNITHLYISIKNNIQQYFNNLDNKKSSYLIVIPFEGNFFETEIELNTLLSRFDFIINSFFKVDDNVSEEILIYQENLTKAFCLFREEHRYYISVW